MILHMYIHITLSFIRVVGSLDLPCQTYLFFAYLVITSTLSSTLTISYIRLLSTPAKGELVICNLICATPFSFVSL